MRIIQFTTKEKIMLNAFWMFVRQLWSTPVLTVDLVPEQPQECHRPLWNKSEKQDAIWGERVLQKTTREFGTVAAALALLREVQQVFASDMEVIYSPFTERHYCIHTDWFFDLLQKLPPDQLVGDPQDVSYLFGKKLRIGYSIERDSVSGLTQEILESLDERLAVLRLDGKIIAAYPSAIVRMESRGGINIM